MENSVLLLIFLTLVIVCTIMLSKKIRVAYPILLVFVGLVLSFIPGLPKVDLEPKVVFILFYRPFYMKPLGLALLGNCLNGEGLF